jgi:hypothetical protein
VKQNRLYRDWLGAPDPFERSLRTKLRAMCRRTARFCGPLSMRLRAQSSFMVTSRHQCKQFSTPHYERTTSPNRSADKALLIR